MTGTVRSLAAALAISLVGLAAACGGGSPLGSAKPDSQAVAHSYQAQGFSIAFGPQWDTTHQTGAASSTSSTSSSGDISWSVTIGPSTQDAASPSPSPQSSPTPSPSSGWQLELTRSASGGELAVFVQVTAHGYGDPAAFVSQYEQLLKMLGGTGQRITLNGTPALYWKGINGDNVALASGSHTYVLHGQVPTGAGSQDRARELAVLASFRLLSASSAPTTP